MKKRIYKFMYILIAIFICAVPLSSCKYNNPINRKAEIIKAELSKDEANILSSVASKNTYVFEVKNVKGKYKKISIWVDEYDNGKLKNNSAKNTVQNISLKEFPKYVEVSFRNAHNSNTEMILSQSIVTNIGVYGDERIIPIYSMRNNEIENKDSSNSEAVLVNVEESKDCFTGWIASNRPCEIKENETINLVIMVQNNKDIGVMNSIFDRQNDNALKDLMKNKKVYIFRCKFHR